MTLYIIAVLVIVVILVQLMVVKRRQRRDYSEYLESVLKDKDLQLISSVFPGWFNVGPFPKFEAEFGRPQSKIPFLGSGEFSQYRIVTVSDLTGQEYRLWALLDFEMFKLRHIRWRVESGCAIPNQLSSLIEK